MEERASATTTMTPRTTAIFYAACLVLSAWQWHHSPRPLPTMPLPDVAPFTPVGTLFGKGWGWLGTCACEPNLERCLRLDEKGKPHVLYVRHRPAAENVFRRYRIPSLSGPASFAGFTVQLNCRHCFQDYDRDGVPVGGVYGLVTEATVFR